MGSTKRATSENLLAVLALHELGSYGAAAEALDRDSATIKYHLTAAREAYDDAVLAYTKGAWQPTAKGLKVLELAHKARTLKDALSGLDQDGLKEPSPATEDAA